MQFKDGTSVYSSDGQHVGHIDRVVLNPRTKEVTDIVVRKGFLFTEDKIVPFNLIASATEDRVSLRKDANKLDALLPFEETHYIEADLDNVNLPVGTSSALYWYPPMGGSAGYLGGLGYAYPTPYKIETEQNIPKGTIALKEGARVFSDDKQHVGNVTRVVTESQSDQAISFVISEGVFFKVKKLIPVAWIREIQEGEIHLSVGTTVLDKLPDLVSLL